MAAGHESWWHLTLIAEYPTPEISRHLVETVAPDPLETFLDLAISENGDRFDFNQAPWVRLVLEWWMDPEVEWIYLIQGSQTSKTTTMMGLLLYAAKYAPAPGFWVGAVEEEVDQFVVQRLKPFLETADAETRTERKTDWRTSDLRIYGRMLMHFAWATSGAKLRSWPARYVFGDETGIWPVSVPGIGNPLEYVKKRTRRYRRNRKGIFGTTPSSDLHPAWGAAKMANFARWHVPCLECGHEQFIDFHRQIRFENAKDGDTRDLKRVRATTHFECEACGARATERDKVPMITRGRGVYVDPDNWAPRELDRANRARTLQIPGTYSPFTPWADLVVNFLESKDQGTETLRVFVTDELAMPWRETGDAPAGQDLVRCIDTERPPGVVPDEAFAITAAVDVQADRVYYSVWAWGLAMRSWLVQYGMIVRPPDTRSLNFLDDVLLCDYDGWPVHRAFIDSGFEPDHVYAYCRRVGMRRISPSKGGNSPSAEPVRPSVIERNAANQKVPGGLRLYMLNPFFWKGWVHDHIKVNRGDPGEWRLHNETDPSFMRQILAEARVERIRAGQVQREWVLTDRTAGSHQLDCAAMAAAAAWDLGVQRCRTRPNVRKPGERSAPAPKPKQDERSNVPQIAAGGSGWAITPFGV